MQTINIKNFRYKLTLFGNDITIKVTTRFNVCANNDKMEHRYEPLKNYALFFVVCVHLCMTSTAIQDNLPHSDIKKLQIRCKSDRSDTTQIKLIIQIKL